MTAHEAFIARLATAALSSSLVFAFAAIFLLVNLSSFDPRSGFQVGIAVLTVAYCLGAWLLLRLPYHNSRGRAIRWAVALCAHVAIILVVLAAFSWKSAVLVLCTAELIGAVCCVYGFVLARLAVVRDTSTAPEAGA